MSGLSARKTFRKGKYANYVAWYGVAYMMLCDVTYVRMRYIDSSYDSSCYVIMCTCRRIDHVGMG